MNRPGAANVELAKAAANLALVTGRVGKPSCGVHIFSEKVNSQGAVDMGLGPDLLPGFSPDVGRCGQEQVREGVERASSQG